jgi:hypothetical protein
MYPLPIDTLVQSEPSIVISSVGLFFKVRRDVAQFYALSGAIHELPFSFRKVLFWGKNSRKRHTKVLWEILSAYRVKVGAQNRSGMYKNDGRALSCQSDHLGGLDHDFQP